MRKLTPTFYRLGVALLLAASPAWITGCGDDTTSDENYTKITISPKTVTISVGGTQSFEVKGTLGDGSTKTITSQVTFKSSDEAVVKMAGSKATGQKEGTATITASYKDLSDKAEVTVKTKEIKDIQVTPATKEVGVGVTVPYTATVNYTDGSTMDATQTATWSSSDATVASIDATGAAQALKEGTTTITAELSGFSGTASLTVTSKKPTSIVITPATESIIAGEKLQYKAEVIYEDNSKDDVTDQVTWESSNTGVATIDATGEAEGVAEGTTTITATLSSVTPAISGQATLNVTAATITKVEIDPLLAETYVGGATVTFTATAIFSDGTSTPNVQATWNTSDINIATIDDSGVASPVAEGTVQITATYLGVTSAVPAVLVVKSGIVDEIIVTPANESIAKGTTKQYKAMAIYSDGNSVDVTSSAAWQSSVITIATMSPTVPGLASGVNAGTTEISATFGNKTGKTNLTVTSATLVSITISPATKQTIPLGITIPFSAEGIYSDNSKQDLTNDVTWLTNPTGIVNFNVNVAKGDAVGTTTVTASFGGVTSNAVEVEVTAATLLTITIDNPPDGPIPVGATYGFIATGHYSDGTIQDLTLQVVWDSSDDTKATISNAVGSKGIAIAIAGGETTITATMGTVTSDGVTLTVATGVTLSYITVEPATDTVNVGQSVQYEAIGHYSNGIPYNITATVVWSIVTCENPPQVISGFATVDKGVVTGVAHTNTLECPGGGYVRVMAKFGNIQGLAKVYVKDTTIQSISVVCEEVTDCLPAGIGFEISCQATAINADGTPTNVTATADWDTTNHTAAVASTVKGKITIVGSGTFQVTATQTGVTGTSVTIFRGAVMTLTPTGYYPFDDSIMIDPMLYEMNKGQQVQYAAWGFFTTQDQNCEGYNEGFYQFNITLLVNWISVNENVAVIVNSGANKGLATGQAAGSTQVSATMGIKTSPIGLLTINDACIQKVVIDGAENKKFPTNVVTSLTVKIYWSDSADPQQIIPGSMGKWTPNATCLPENDIYSVNPNTWQLTVGQNNCSTITYTLSSSAVCNESRVVSDYISVTVDTSATMTGFVVEPEEGAMNLGGVQDYVSKATYGSYGTFNVSSLTSWDNLPGIPGLQNKAAAGGDIPQPATLPARRFYHSLAVGGTTTITATYKNLSDTSTLNIAGRTVTKVEVINPPSSATGYPVGVKIPLQAKVTWSDGEWKINPTGIVFASSDNSKLSIPSNSLIATTVAVSGGVNPTVTATYESVNSAPMPVVINNATLTTMRYSWDGGQNWCEGDATQNPPNCIANLNLNANVILIIQGVYSNGTYADISTQVISASGNDTIVTVSTTTDGTTIQTHSTPTSGTPVTLSFIKDGLTRWLGVNVTAAACLTTVAITPDPVSLFQGQSQTFVATATDTASNPSIVTGSGSWGSSSSSILSNAGAVFTASSVNTGSVTVNFSLTGANVCAGGDVNNHTISDTASVTVDAAAIASVYIRARNYQGTEFDPGATLHVPLNESVQLEGWAKMTAGPDQRITTASGTVWNSQVSTIVEVTTTGLITAKSANLTVITLTSANGKTANLSVSVTDCGVPEVTIAGSTAVLPVGQTRSFTSTANFNGGGCSGWTANERMFNVTVRSTWGSSAAAATINAQGVATGVSEGDTTVTAQFGGKTSNGITFHVAVLNLYTLTVTQPFTQVGVGDGGAITLSVAAVWRDGANNEYNLDPPVVDWTINNGAVIKIEGPTDSHNKKYKLTGLQVNSTNYYAHVGTLNSNTNVINVVAACFVGISITNPAGSVTWPRAVPFQLEFTCTTSNGDPLACNPTFNKTDANSIIADPYNPSAGTFAANGAGRINEAASAGQTAQVSASINGCNGTITSTARTITVGSATLSSVTIPDPIKMAKGTTRLVPATAVFAGGTGEGSYNVTYVSAYNSATPAIASTNTPNPGSGSITSNQVDGTTLLTATFLGTPSNVATVEVSGRALTKITITVVNQFKYLGGGTNYGMNTQYPANGFLLQLKGEGDFSDNSKDDITASLLWEIVDTTGQPMVPGSSVTADGGLVTTGTPGGAATHATQWIKASMDNVTATFSIEIVNGAITTITIVDVNGSPVVTSIPRGLESNFYATVTLIDGSMYQAVRNVNWASTDETKGTIVQSGTEAGKFKAIDIGTTNISAELGSVSSGPLAITITNAVAVSIYCVPGSLTLASGGTAQLQAYLRNSFGPDTPVTSDAITVWTSANNGIATFSTPSIKGLVTGVNSGTTTVYPVYTGVPTPTGADRCAVNVP